MPDDWKTIRVPPDVYDDAKQRKEAWDVTWAEYLNPHAWHTVFEDPDEIDRFKDGFEDADGYVEWIDGAVDIESVIPAKQADVPSADEIASAVVDKMENAKDD